MKNNKSIRITRASTAVLLAGFALTLSACESSTNAGGDTTCGTFSELDSSQQRAVIQTFLASKGNNDPAGWELTLNVTSAQLYCATLGSASDPIKNIDG